MNNQTPTVKTENKNQTYESNKVFNIIIIPNFHLFGKYNINDRMAVCTFSNYRAFGYTFENMLSDSRKMKLHAETYVGYNFKKYHIDVRYIDFFFNRVRADGRVTKDYKLPDSNQRENTAISDFM